jgi:hypothetical protein
MWKKEYIKYLKTTMPITDQKLLKISKLLSGGEGSDHFSPSQLNLPFLNGLLIIYVALST